ncbi:MAG: cytochrome c biogenesis protein ResB [Elusimicrobia bacterium]|nr:cytochrome c biogenesis protein ResB [Elusimicrobiota bacterium]
MNSKWKAVLGWLGSLQLTLLCLGAMMLLVFFGTLAQTTIGTFAAQRAYFNHFFIWTSFGGVQLPLLPGGLSIGLLWLVNLVAAFIVRFKWRAQDAGILISHLGLILLIAGQGLTQLLARESQMPVQEGATANYSESAFDTELAVTMTSDPSFDEVVRIPYRFFDHPGTIRTPHLPFELRVLRFFRNAELARGGGESLANRGVGMQVQVTEAPPTFADNDRNNTTAYVEVTRNGESLGVWLLSLDLGAPQSVTVDGKEYRLNIRPRRFYYPFALTLKKFRHDVYPGTDIAKNFSSQVHLSNAAKGEERDALIYMNHPLRYEGHTFYQASFGNNDTLSVFQVVQNPAWITPYLACLLVALGLAIQFLWHLADFARSREAEA